MAELKTSRPYEERFLEGFDRSQLRMEVQKVKPKGMRRMKRRYATWALGASLAIGGLGAPIKMIQNTNANSARQTAGESLDGAIAGDLETAQSIASQVAGGVAAGVVGAAGSVGDAAASSLKTVGEAPAKLALFTESAREQFFRTEVPFGSIIYREAKKNDLRPEMVAAMIQQESRFKPTARSPVGAVGLMQLVPKTGKWMGARDLTNPTQNIQAGTKYLKYLNERFDGNETIVIAAYNAGEGNVRRFGGVPPFKETQNYLKKVRTYEKEFASRVQSHLADATMGVAEAR